jgi:hypothetical protein
MKQKSDVFCEQMPKELNQKILHSAQGLLKENKIARRRQFFKWFFGAGLTTAMAGVILFFQKNNSTQFAEMNASIDFFENIQSEDDLEMFANFEVLQDLDLIEHMDDES